MIVITVHRDIALISENSENPVYENEKLKIRMKMKMKKKFSDANTIPVSAAE